MVVVLLCVAAAAVVGAARLVMMVVFCSRPKEGVGRRSGGCGCGSRLFSCSWPGWVALLLLLLLRSPHPRPPLFFYSTKRRRMKLATRQQTGTWVGQQRAAGLLVVIHAAAAAARCLCLLLAVSLLLPLQPQHGRRHDNAAHGVSCRRPPSLLLACVSTRYQQQIGLPLMVRGKQGTQEHQGGARGGLINLGGSNAGFLEHARHHAALVYSCLSFVCEGWYYREKGCEIECVLVASACPPTIIILLQSVPHLACATHLCTRPGQ